MAPGRGGTDLETGLHAGGARFYPLACSIRLVSR